MTTPAFCHVSLALVSLVAATSTAQSPPRLARATEPIAIPDFGGTTSHMAAADVDGDGDVDVFLSRLGDADSRILRLLINDGRGAFTDASAARLPSAPAVSEALHPFDMDGDGDMDLLIAGAGNRLYENDGTGMFSDVTAGRLPPAVDATSDFATGDVDGDGDHDIVVASYDPFPGLFGGPGRQSLLLLNDGAGTFIDVTATHMPVALDQTRKVLLFNADQDPELELYLSNEQTAPSQATQGADRIYDNDGSGVFTAVLTALPNENQSARDAVAADVDLDGDLDLIRVGFFANHSALLINDGTGTFQDTTTVSAPTLNAAASVGAADMTGDGIVDLFLASSVQTGHSNVLLEGDGLGGFVDATDRLPPDVDDTRCAAFVDLDGNGSVDVATGASRSAYQNWSRDRVYLQRAGGSGFDQLPSYDLPASTVYAEAMATTDVDGDGDADIVLGDWFYANALFYGDGHGGFTAATPAQFPILDGHTRALEFGDVDGDGDQDLWIGNGTNTFTQDQLLLNDGNGTFTDVTATHVPANSDRTFAVAMGDVDGDGDLDVVTGLGQHNLTANRLLRNNGSGVFTFDDNALPPTMGRTRSIELVDLDGDGDLDLTWGDWDQNAILINDGLGNFTDETGTRYPATPFPYGSPVRAADVDGDGDQDLFYSGHAGLANRLFLNDGAGFFTDVSGSQLPGNLPTIACELADMDNDGDADIVLGHNGAALYLNDGNGIFSDATSTVEVDSDVTHSMVLADVDRDRDLDVVLGRYMRVGNLNDRGAHVVLRNNLRQWQSLDLPLGGEDYHVELTLFGKSGVVAGPLLAFAPLDPGVSVLDFGVLSLDPTAIIGLPGITTDADGRATMTLPISPLPGALGLTLYTQAFVVETGDPANWRLTGRQAHSVR